MLYITEVQVALERGRWLGGLKTRLTFACREEVGRDRIVLGRGELDGCLGLEFASRGHCEGGAKEVRSSGWVRLQVPSPSLEFGIKCRWQMRWWQMRCVRTFWCCLDIVLFGGVVVIAGMRYVRLGSGEHSAKRRCET